MRNTITWKEVTETYGTKEAGSRHYKEALEDWAKYDVGIHETETGSYEISYKIDVELF